MKKMIFALILSLLLAPLAAAGEIPLTLDETISIALRYNRDIQLKEEDLRKAKAKLTEANAGLFPTLDVTASRALTRGYYAKDIAQTTTQTTLKQYLYKGGEIINTIKYEGYKIEAAEALLDKEKLETVLKVKKAFYALLLADEFYALNKAILANTAEHLDLARKRQESGQASESDILNIEASLESVKEAHESSLSQKESGRILLNNLLYLDKETLIRPEAEFAYEAIELAYDEAFLKAMQRRPEIRQYEAQIKADKRSVEIAKADARPNIYASWDYYSRSTTSLTFSPTKGWQDYNIAGLTFSWPVFDGWETKAKVQQALIDLKETRLTKEKAIHDIALELKNAYLGLKDALTGIKTAESQISLYRDNFSGAGEKYSRGIISQLDLNDAQLKYAIASFNKKQAVYDYLVAKNTFEKATGGI